MALRLSQVLQRLIEIIHIREKRLVCYNFRIRFRFFFRFFDRFHQCLERIKFFFAAVEHLCKGLGIFALLDRGHHDTLFLFNRKLAEKHGRVSDVLQCLLFFRNQNFDNPHIAIDMFVAALDEHVSNVRTFLLAITINTTVPLLEHHQRPRNIKMNQPMAEIMQIQSLGCHIRCNQHPDRRFGTTKVLHDLLLLRFTHASRNFLNRICL